MSMKLESASYRDLFVHDERTIAHFAARARGDTIFGGCAALVLAKRLRRMNPRSDAENVVSAVYSASTGHRHTELEAWKCPECGSAHLGQDTARQCCANVEENEGA